MYTSNRLDQALKDIVRAHNKQEEAIAEREDREPVLLPHISNHMLRHTFCTRLCERDVNVKVIQTVMGHASINITLDIYAEVSKAKQFAEIDRLADAIKKFFAIIKDFRYTNHGASPFFCCVWLSHLYYSKYKVLVPFCRVDSLDRADSLEFMRFSMCV